MKYFSKKIVSIDALKQNYKNLLGSGYKICAVVKADAYGHCAKKICLALSDCCNFFAVQNLYEALELRKINKSATILVLGYCIDYKKAQKYNISVSIDNINELKKIIKLNKKINIHLKINTGMNRLGIINFKDFIDILNLIKINNKINVEGIYTHCFCTQNKEITKKQITKFKNYTKYLKKYNFNPIVHVGGSGMVNYKLNFVDYIRCGIALFGYLNNNTKPIMKLQSKVLKITNIKKGDYVGYDCFYRATENLKIALIPLGYADGIVRNFQDDMFVTYKNHKLKVVGKICMDMFMVDVTNVDIKVGEFVTVFDDAKLWAKKSSLSEYEILTGLNHARCDIIFN